MSKGEASKILVVLEKTDSGYSSYLPDLPGCIATGESLNDVRGNIKDAIDFHLEGLRLQVLPTPAGFQRDFNLAYKMDVSSLFEWFSGILTKSGVSKLTGMNQSLISQYVSGSKSPSAKQTKRIERALHNLGQELLEIEL
jgi:predicted RNase H-like HicB family nuclease